MNLQVHPFGPCEGLTWLSRVMNLEPQPDVTATMLYDFLEVCSHTLASTYGGQFFELLEVLWEQYFPKIEAITPAFNGPVLRLKNFLETCIKTQTFPPPKGMLTDEFWRC
ncbi:mRNA export factor GLE1-like [Amphiura filiformis]|uniref:mRNA export factor GLE1-like n=1 Tax=Amphiura filiformis TaxID=82378 RepID=UPI003B21FCBD